MKKTRNNTLAAVLAAAITVPAAALYAAPGQDDQDTPLTRAQTRALGTTEAGTAAQDDDDNADGNAEADADRQGDSPRPQGNADRADQKSADQDIVAIANSNQDFSTLAKALKAADLIDTLKAEGPFTVFAPTDEAFDELPEGTLEDLLKDENKDKLREILSYHVVANKLTSDTIAGAMQPETLAGSSLDVDPADGMVNVNDAQVVKPDVMAKNGVIHGINKVLMPEKYRK